MSRLRDQVIPCVCDSILKRDWDALFDAEVSPVWLTLPTNDELHDHWDEGVWTNAAFRLLCGQLWRDWMRYKKKVGKKQMPAADTISRYLFDTLGQKQ